MTRNSTRFAKRVGSLRKATRQLRRNLLRLHLVGFGESMGESLASIDVLAYLRFGWLTRLDRLVLSGGNGVSELLGLIDKAGLRFPAGKLAVCPPEESLRRAVDLAYARRVSHGEGARVACLLGAREAGLGSTLREAVRAARDGISALTVVVDARGGGELSDVAATLARWQALGFAAMEVDGQDVNSLHAAMHANVARPKCVVMKTTGGRGVSFGNDPYAWNYVTLRPEQFAMVMAGLEDRES